MKIMWIETILEIMAFLGINLAMAINFLRLFVLDCDCHYAPFLISQIFRVFLHRIYQNCFSYFYEGLGLLDHNTWRISDFVKRKNPQTVVISKPSLKNAL